MPGWFLRSLEVPFEDRVVEVAGTPIHYLYWEEPQGGQRPGLVFVHGNGAHAHWWTFLAPFFLEHHRVAAVDLSGAGDSGWRDRYTPEQYAEEVAAVATDAGFGDDVIIVGHSFGGYITLKTGLLYHDRLAGIVLVDSAVRPPGLQVGARSPAITHQTKTPLRQLRRGARAVPSDAASGLQEPVPARPHRPALADRNR
jgi:pimeloyl-ACP methyl ester carboxylesterase